MLDWWFSCVYLSQNFQSARAERVATQVESSHLATVSEGAQECLPLTCLLVVRHLDRVVAEIQGLDIVARKLDGRRQTLQSRSSNGIVGKVEILKRYAGGEGALSYWSAIKFTARDTTAEDCGFYCQLKHITASRYVPSPVLSSAHPPSRSRLRHQAASTGS